MFSTHIIIICHCHHPSSTTHSLYINNYTSTFTQAQAEERATQDLQQELSSGRRLLLFAFLTAVLLSVAAVDALSEQPSWPQITLYVLLAAMFGAITVGEKKFLAEWKEQGPARDRGGKR